MCVGGGGGNNEVKNAVNNGFTMAVMTGVIMEAIMGVFFKV